MNPSASMRGGIQTVFTSALLRERRSSAIARDHVGHAHSCKTNTSRTWSGAQQQLKNKKNIKNSETLAYVWVCYYTDFMYVLSFE